MSLLAPLLLLWTLWTLDSSGVQGPAPTRELPVGSLSKPFVVQAWARAHPYTGAPVVECDRRSGCWRSSGHGTVDLRRAAAVSCNTYFKALAAATPPGALAATLRAAGFTARDALTPDAAIGLDKDGVAAPRIAPRDLLAAYVRLTREPWPAGETHRQALLAGLRDAPLEGTAAGVGHRGLWAKTGTVRSLTGPSWRTSGLALVVDDSGWAALGLLDPGTGREAAARMAAVVASRGTPATTSRPSKHEKSGQRARAKARSRTADSETGGVRVRLFELLRPKAVSAVNTGPAPVQTSEGFVGPGRTVSLRSGETLAAGSWELRIPERRVIRQVEGSIVVGTAADGELQPVVAMTPREYANGILLAELGPGNDEHRIALAAAALRFARAGARHDNADVCDSTHCAWFLGRGPYVRWPEARSPLSEGGGRPLTDDEWSKAAALADEPGPARWTSDCGGQPLSPHAVWGGSNRGVSAHPPHGVKRWDRQWTAAEVAKALSDASTQLRIAWPDGTWRLEVVKADGSVDALRYDEAHDRIAQVLGWGALPSPADRITKTPGGYRVEGVGLGHRVGLCLRAAATAPGSSR